MEQGRHMETAAMASVVQAAAPTATIIMVDVAAPAVGHTVHIRRRRPRLRRPRPHRHRPRRRHLPAAFKRLVVGITVCLRRQATVNGMVLTKELGVTMSIALALIRLPLASY